MSEISDKFIVHSVSDCEIVFASYEDLSKFFDDLTAGKWVVVTAIDEAKNVKSSVLIRPDVRALIIEGRMVLKALEPVKPAVKKV